MGVIIVTRFGFDCYGTLGAFPWLRVTLTFAGLYGIEALPKPSLLGPGPVAIEVWIEYRPFHDDPRNMNEQSACHIGVVNFLLFLSVSRHNLTEIVSSLQNANGLCPALAAVL